MPSSHSTGEELIRGYIYQYTKDREHAERSYRLNRQEELTNTEKKLNASLKAGKNSKRQPKKSQPDWKESADFAIEEYRSGRLLVFVDREQLQPGSPALPVPVNATIHFGRIMMLVGG